MNGQQLPQELTLSFRVPETDFDLVSLEIALGELEQRFQRYEERNNQGLVAAYQILHTLHTRYVTEIGKPEWRKPNVLE